MCPRVHCFSIRGLPRPGGKLKIKEIERFISFKTRAKWERAVTWWNLGAQTRPLLDSSSSVPVLTLHRRTWLHSVSSVLAVRISCRVIAVFVFREPLFINQTLPYLCLIHAYHVIYSVRYYSRFHPTAVSLWTYYPWIRGHTCIRITNLSHIIFQQLFSSSIWYITAKLNKYILHKFFS
jgi:hypothetical protein